jgi:hypothetical protein
VFVEGLKELSEDSKSVAESKIEENRWRWALDQPLRWVIHDNKLIA